jgi:cytochrome b
MAETLSSGGIAADADARLATEGAATIPVWDRFVRLFHWSLSAAIIVALATSLVLPPTWITLHIVSGTLAVALVGLRIVWGWLGPSYARFASFVRGPRAVAEHAAGLIGGTAPRHLGHNPLGGVMILALLAAVAALAATGVVVLGGDLKSGPLAFATTFATGEVFRGIHQLIAYGLIGLIVLHIGGAIFESRRSGENLVAAMVDGRKATRPGDIAASARSAHPALALLVAIPLLAISAAVIAWLAERPGLGVPSAPLDPVYAEECGACHAPFHPSLAPAATWSAIMDGLTNHFGEDASLDPATAAAIGRYLNANSAEAYDTKAANRLRRVDPADPLRITATPFWQRIHARIPDRVFTAKAVAARSNCGACHADALSGRFDPSAIAIPEDGSQ